MSGSISLLHPPIETGTLHAPATAGAEMKMMRVISAAEVIAGSVAEESLHGR